MIVEFIGCSGAGKTTLADAIERIGGPRSTISGTGLIVDHPGLRWISDPTAVNLVADVISFPPFLRALGRQKDFVAFAFDRLRRHAPSPFARYNYMLNVVRKLGVNEMARRAAGREDRPDRRRRGAVRLPTLRIQRCAVRPSRSRAVRSVRCRCRIGSSTCERRSTSWSIAR
jgi:hypothetical protein